MRQYLDTARANEIHYQTPDIVFYFVQGVTEPLANLLRRNGITVKVNRIIFRSSTRGNSHCFQGFNCGSKRRRRKTSTNCR